MFNIPVQRKQEWIQLLEEESVFTHFIFADQKILNSVSLTLKKYLFAFMVRFLRLRGQLCVFLENANLSRQKKSLCPHVPFSKRGVRVIFVFSHVTGSVYKRFFQVLTLNDLELPSTDEVREISTIYFLLEREITWSEFWNSIPL